MVISKSAGKYFEMPEKKSVADIDPIDGITSKDFVVVQLNGGATGLIQLKNFVLGPENVNFYQLIKDVSNTNNTLLDNSLSAVDSYDDLRAYNATNGKLMYVRAEGKESFFQFRTSVGSDNGGTILTAGDTGGWERVDVDKVNIDWFLDDREDPGDINQPKILSAIEYASNKGVPLHFPDGSPIITDPFTILKSVSIIGNGLGSTLKLPSDTNALSFVSVSANNVSIKDLGLEKNNASVTNGLELAAGTGISVENCNITEFSPNIKVNSSISKYYIKGNDLRQPDSSLSLDIVGSEFGVIEGNMLTSGSNDNPLIELSAAANIRVVNNFCGNERSVTELDSLTSGPIRSVGSSNLITKNNYNQVLQSGEDQVSVLFKSFVTVGPTTINNTPETFTPDITTQENTLTFENGLLVGVNP